MLVKLKRNFYAANGKLYKSNEGVQDIPDYLCKVLPSDAQTFDAKGNPIAKPKTKGKAPAPAKKETATPDEAATPDADAKTTEDGGEQVPDFESMNFTALKKHAEANFIDLAGATSKVAALAAIKAGKKDKSAEMNALLGQ